MADEWRGEERLGRKLPLRHCIFLGAHAKGARRFSLKAFPTTPSISHLAEAKHAHLLGLFAFACLANGRL